MRNNPNFQAHTLITHSNTINQTNTMSDDTAAPPSSSKKKRDDKLPEELDSLTKDDLNCILIRPETLDADYGNNSPAITPHFCCITPNVISIRILHWLP